MKILLLIVAMGFAPAHALTIVSDLDDTIKHTHVGNVRETIENALFSKVPFGGMVDLYDSMANRLYVVSGSPKHIRFIVEDFLQEAGFVWTKLFLRESLFNDLENFKQKTISQLILHSPESVLLVGDDTEKDPEIFTRLKNQYPKKVKGVYIRKVKGRTLPKGAIGFFHPFEIAAHEWQQGRLNEDTIIRLGREMETEFIHTPHYYFPEHVICPMQTTQLQLNALLYSRSTILRRLAESTAHRTARYCSL